MFRCTFEISSGSYVWTFLNLRRLDVLSYFSQLKEMLTIVWQKVLSLIASGDFGSVQKLSRHPQKLSFVYLLKPWHFDTEGHYPRSIKCLYHLASSFIESWFSVFQMTEIQYRQVIGKEVMKRNENAVISFTVEYQAGIYWDKSVCKQPSLLIVLVFVAISNVIFYLTV